MMCIRYRSGVLAIILVLLFSLSPFADHKKGYELYSKGDYQGAIKEFQASLEKTPDFWYAQFMIVRCYKKMGNFTQALEEQIKAFAIAQDNSQKFATGYELADIYYLHKDYSEAIKALNWVKEFAAKTNEKGALSKLLGLCYMNLNDFKQAASALEEASLSLPQDKDILKLLDTCYEELHNNDEIIIAIAYTIVLKDGRYVRDIERYIIDGNKVHIELKDSMMIISLTEIDFEKTFEANQGMIFSAPKPVEEEKPQLKEELETTKEKSSNIIEFVNHNIRSLPADFSRDSAPYNAHVRAYFQFKNNSNKTLTGLIYKVKFLDSFGDVLYEEICKDQLKIGPGNLNPMTTFWYWENNEFIDGEPYDKLQAATGAGTIKVEITIQKAVFSDGSVIEFKK